MNLVQFARSLFAFKFAVRKSAVRKSAVRAAPLRRFPPQVEGLTERIMPAVSATVSGGVLIVNAAGAAADDRMTIAPVAGFAGRFLLTGTNNTVVNTNVNGTLDAVGVTSMRFALGEGNDSVRVEDVILAGGISFLGGNGANTFELATSFIGGSVFVTNGTNTVGNDVTDIRLSSINGNVFVNNGLGSTTGTFRGSFFLGGVSYATASSALTPGNDTIEATGLRIGGSMNLALGNGTNSFSVPDAISGPIEVAGNFIYTGGAGGDSLAFNDGVTIGSSLLIQLGEGPNAVGASGDTTLFVGARLAVTSGAGVDIISLTTSALPRVVGAASFNLGGGNNIVSIRSLAVGSLSLTAGTGNDTGDFDNLRVLGAATLNFGAGANTINLASTSASTFASTIGGALTLTTGAGADTIKVGSNNAFRVGGAARFTTGTAAAGNGNDSLQINNALFGSSLSIFGGSGGDSFFLASLTSIGIAGRLTVVANAGDDRLDLGVAGDSNKVVRLLLAPILSGGTGTGDVIRIFGQGNLQGPPSIGVLPTGPSLLAAGWEAIL